MASDTLYQKLEDVFGSIQKQMVMQTSFLESMYHMEVGRFAFEKERAKDEQRQKDLEDAFEASDKKENKAESIVDDVAAGTFFGELFEKMFEKGFFGIIAKGIGFATKAIFAAAAGVGILGFIEGLTGIPIGETFTKLFAVWTDDTLSFGKKILETFNILTGKAELLATAVAGTVTLGMATVLGLLKPLKVLKGIAVSLGKGFLKFAKIIPSTVSKLGTGVMETTANNLTKRSVAPVVEAGTEVAERAAAESTLSYFGRNAGGLIARSISKVLAPLASGPAIAVYEIINPSNLGPADGFSDTFELPPETVSIVEDTIANSFLSIDDKLRIIKTVADNLEKQLSATPMGRAHLAGIKKDLDRWRDPEAMKRDIFRANNKDVLPHISPFYDENGEYKQNSSDGLMLNRFFPTLQSDTTPIPKETGKLEALDRATTNNNVAVDARQTTINAPTTTVVRTTTGGSSGGGIGVGSGAPDRSLFGAR